MANRVQRYAQMTDPVHFLQIDADLDDFEKENLEIKQRLRVQQQEFISEIKEVRREMKEGFEACIDRDGKSNKIQVAILSSLVVAAIVLILNVIVLQGVG